MATDIPMRMVEGNGARKWTSSDAAKLGPSLSNMAAEELGLLLGGHRLQGNGAASTPNRSGSAPPSMEGSFAALANLLSQQNVNLDPSLASLSNALQNCKSEEQLRSDPAYISYYCSHVNLNPRIPPPLISPENRRLVNHIGGFGNNHKLVSIDDGEARPLHLSGGSLFTHVEEPEDDNKALDDMVKGPVPMFDQNDISSGRHKSLVDLIQEDFPRTPSPVYQSRHSSEELIDHDLEALALNISSMDISKISEPSLGSMDEIAERCAVDDRSQTSFPTLSSQKLTTKQDGELLCKEAEVGNEASVSGIDASRDDDGSNTNKTEQQTYEGNLPLHRNASHRAPPLQIPVVHGQMIFQGPNPPQGQIERFPLGNPKSSAEGQFAMHSPGPAHPLYAPAGTYVTSNPYYPNLHPQGVFAHQYGIGGYAVGSTILPPYMATYPPHGAFPLPFEVTQSPGFNDRTGTVSAGHGIPSGGDMPHMNKMYGQHAVGYQPPFVDPVQLQYLHHTFDDAYGGSAQFARFPRGGVSGHSNSFTSQYEGPIANHMSDQKFQFPANGGVGISNPRKADVMGNSYYGSSPSMGVMTQFSGSPLASPVLPSSPVGGMNPFGRRSEMRFVQGSARNGGMYNSWQSPRGAGSFDDPKRNSFLEELKSSHSRKFELPDIAGRIVEFSVDQHGSRFIQQKLENCTVEEKADVFKEVLPHASKLMTDVFGNYVIQKFFEYGSAAQRKELADQLTGQMLPLSLQMYGCRVIQKALDVIELNQKTQLVLELDGQVMRCVRDQNGNHVIQKCIECLPSDKIGFIISAFRGQVTSLSTHPYGCRVIQRVLEHCSDEDQSQCIVDEILESACVLAEDQYGNYVTQHVLERGRPRERAEIISKLTGKIVHMSQHKYASNVVEKCLEYGDAAEREFIIEEIIAGSEENDNLLAMMKDQFANYVVQKILEVSSDNHREILLSRIKTHLNALRKYTYGKHIVARFEQLTGEEEPQPSESNSA